MLNLEQALSPVPPGAPNRDALARLLVTVNEAAETIAADAQQVAWYSRLRHIGALLLITECAPNGTRAYSKTHDALRAAINAARMHARRWGLTPNTRRDIRASARLVADALK